MDFIAWLFLLGLLSAAAFYLGGRKGLVALAVLIVAFAVFYGSRSDNNATLLLYIVGYGALPLLLAAGAGVFLGERLRGGHYAWVAVALLSLGAAGWWHYRSQMREVDEHLQVTEFVAHHPKLGKLAGEPLKFNLASSTQYSGSGHGSYDFALQAREPLYAIVDVDRDTDPPTVRLRCVTTLSMGKREGGADDCAKGLVSLDDTTWAVARKPDVAASQAIPEIPPIPRDVAIHAIGVYEAKNRPREPANNHEPGDVVVTVQAGKEPLLLVLTSYEPIRWQVRNLGRPIVGVFTSGYFPSTVTGTDAKVANIGRDYVSQHERQGGRIETRMRVYSSGPYRSQAAYYGTEFTVPAP